jgi:hypothetical protein
MCSMGLGAIFLLFKALTNKVQMCWEQYGQKVPSWSLVAILTFQNLSQTKYKWDREQYGQTVPRAACFGRHFLPFFLKLKYGQFCWWPWKEWGTVWATIKVVRWGHCTQSAYYYYASWSKSPICGIIIEIFRHHFRPKENVRCSFWAGIGYVYYILYTILYNPRNLAKRFHMKQIDKTQISINVKNWTFKRLVHLAMTNLWGDLVPKVYYFSYFFLIKLCLKSSHNIFNTHKK